MTAVVRPSPTVGRNGRTIWRLESAPTDADGNIGDSAIVVDEDGFARRWYGPKTEDGWDAGIQIPGKSFIVKTSALSDATDGIDGDYGVTIISGVLRFYGPKTAGAWGSAVVTLPLLLLSGGTMTGFITLHADPQNSMHAATKQYVDGIATNLGKRARVRVATTANITIATGLNNGDAIDGVTLATGDQVLVRAQSSQAENGIYVVGTTPARAAEFDTYDEHAGSLVTVAEGSTYADTVWLCTSNKGGTLGSTAIVWTQTTATGALLASNNLSDLTDPEAAVDNLGFNEGFVDIEDGDLTAGVYVLQASDLNKTMVFKTTVSATLQLPAGLGRGKIVSVRRATSTAVIIAAGVGATAHFQYVGDNRIAKENGTVTIDSFRAADYWTVSEGTAPA